MKGPRGPTWRTALGPVVTVVVLAAGGAAIARVQPRLAAAAHDAKEGDELYVLPPPAQLRTSTLGWEAATVDLLWATLLVEYGTHWASHREFVDVPRYADAILELEPTYAPLYRYIDTLLAYRPLQGTEDDVRLARAYLERGTRERPDDARLWAEYGQFMAFIAPSFLRDDADRVAFRMAGAEAIGHAVELGADADDALAAATLLDRAGVRSQAIGFLERAYALAPEGSDVHDAIGARLTALQASALRDATDAAQAAFEVRRKREMPYVTRARYRLLGPLVDPARCAGLAAAGEPGCARDWTAALTPATAEVSGGARESSAGSP
jgi:hypothetical protein